MKTILIIGFTWPEPTTTAAGKRMLQLINYFLDEKYAIHFASSAKKNEYSYPLENLNISTKIIKLNSSKFDSYVQNLQPNIVLFDRFFTEEQYGWRVTEVCPNAFKILDTEDLHFLRKAREIAFKNNELDYKKYLVNEVTKRELASIYRCDLSLIISKFEYNLLLRNFQIPKEILLYIPFLSSHNLNDKNPSFKERTNFLTVGNFNHQPNWQSVLLLKNKIWPRIRKQLPNAQLLIIGAYNNKAQQLHNNNEGFIIKGWVKNLDNYLLNTKVMLAPIPFGAGLKGKLFESMLYGIPNVTTSFGAEGLNDGENWNGYIENNYAEFALKAIQLYTNEECWKKLQKNGYKNLENNFNKAHFFNIFSEKIVEIGSNLQVHRTKNIIGEIFNSHTLQSFKYLSKWIEAKNKLEQF